jgi:DNA polymerase-3 subunit beta
VGDNAGVSLKCGGITYKLVGMPPDDFPPVVPASPGAWLTLDAKTLRDMLTQTSFAVSHDETRYALNGVLFAVSSKEMRLVATDGHRLALSVRTVGDVGRAITGIVPRKAITEITRVLGAGEEVQLGITENQFVLQMPNFVMTARLIEGQFPNYEPVVPRKDAWTARATLDREAFLAGTRRASFFARDSANIIKVEVGAADGEAAGVTISAHAADVGDNADSLDATVEGSPTTIAFNARYLTDVLGALGAEEAVLELSGPLAPGVIRGVGKDDYVHVIMPVRTAS